MGGGFAFGSAFDSRSGQRIMVALVLMIGSFYACTLLGNNAPAYVSQLSNSSSSSDIVMFTNKVVLTYHSKPLLIPESGIDVCPFSFKEYIPCHDISYVKKLLPSLDGSRRETKRGIVLHPKNVYFAWSASTRL